MWVFLPPGSLDRVVESFAQVRVRPERLDSIAPDPCGAGLEKAIQLPHGPCQHICSLARTGSS